MLKVNHGRGRVLKIPSYLGTETRSSQPKPDEVKMVLYIVEECGMPCFSLAITEWQMSITAEVRPYLFGVFFCFDWGTSVPRRDQGGGLALQESCRGSCWSRYDAYNPKSAMKTVHHWRPTSMHLGFMIEITVAFITTLRVGTLFHLITVAFYQFNLSRTSLHYNYFTISFTSSYYGWF